MSNQTYERTTAFRAGHAAGPLEVAWQARVAGPDGWYLDVVENAPDAIFVHDAAGRILEANRAASQCLGYPREKLLTMRISDFETGIPSEDLAALWEGVLTGDRASVEGVHLRHDGSTYPVEIRLSRLVAGRRPVVIAMVRDLPDRRAPGEDAARQRALEELDRLRDHFLSTISHELRTPLTLIVGYAELLEETSPQARGLVSGILDGCRRLTAHIRNMLDYTALASGTLDVQRTDLALDEVIHHAAAVMSERFQQKGLDLVIESEPETPNVAGDPRRLTQVLLELLDNAVKVSDPGGKVGLRISPSGSQTRLDVWDTGPGIAARDYPRIWEAFSQLEVGDAYRRGGLGLGLALVKRLIELQDGRVGLVSQEGKGTVFSLFLPNSSGCTGCASRECMERIHS